MQFEWDESKRKSNLEKHNLDFALVSSLFDGRPVVTVESFRTEEERFATTGEIDRRMYTVIWTWRGSNIRLISARRARDAEKRDYRSLHSRRD